MLLAYLITQLPHRYNASARPIVEQICSPVARIAPGCHASLEVSRKTNSELCPTCDVLNFFPGYVPNPLGGIPRVARTSQGQSPPAAATIIMTH